MKSPKDRFYRRKWWRGFSLITWEAMAVLESWGEYKNDGRYPPGIVVPKKEAGPWK